MASKSYRWQYMQVVEEDTGVWFRLRRGGSSQVNAVAGHMFV
jgi:hypothetical protein